MDGVLVGCLYLPNGNPRPGLKFDYKLAWFERLIAHADLERAGVPTVLAGDYNLVPINRDIHDMRSWRENALTQPEPRAAFARLPHQAPGHRDQPSHMCRSRTPGCGASRSKAYSHTMILRGTR